ncbi:MAG: CBS domain-containing protein [Nitrospiraceae bacterium]|nr:MAG: CBS domain-containing protein [Nitrospiraceae bacterium]
MTDHEDRADSSAERLLQSRDLLYRLAAFNYLEPLGNIMDNEVYTCRPDDDVRSVAREIARRKISSAIVTDGDGQLRGIVTERDLVSKVVAADPHCGAEKKIREIMTPDPIFLSPRDSLFDALSLLSRQAVKHLPIVADRKVAGIITFRQIMKIRHSEPLVIIGQLQNARTVSDFKLVKEEMIPLVQEKLEANTDPVDIVTMLSLVNASIHRRVLNAVLMEYDVVPAVDFCIFVTGSHGRRENLLFPDQDFCVILDDYQGRDYQDVDRFFTDVSQKLSDRLNAIGFEYCQGEVMGQNPLWRKRLGEWRKHISEIIGHPGPHAVRYMTLIFDAAPLYGNRAFFAQCMDHAWSVLEQNHNILRQMHEEEEGRHKVPLGLFGSFITEKDEPHRGMVDMKRSGLIFIIEAARILALMHGVRDTSTLGRISALVNKGVIHRDDSEYFENAYRVILYHTLHAQVENFVARGVHDYHIKPSDLSGRNRVMLKQAFKAVARLQELVGSEFGELIL